MNDRATLGASSSTSTASRRDSSLRRLRSRAVHAALLGAGAFALSACEEPVDLTFFSDVGECKAAAAESTEFSEGDCERSFEQALAEHAVLAPRYDELALCEEQHGEGACGPSQAAGGAPDLQGDEAAEATAGPTFMPFFMGYMIGNMLSPNRPGGYVGRPVYRDAQGQFFSSDGRKLGFTGAGTKVRGTPSQVRPPELTRVAAPMTRAVVSARGGFGAARTTSFGG
jgi:uncharacterized protein YgiB involved in biofilm formation